MAYKVGDKVKVINYGHNIFHSDNGKYKIIDLNPGIVGKEGTISEVCVVQDKPMYAIDGILGKHAWYEDEQLEMIESNQSPIL